MSHGHDSGFITRDFKNNDVTEAVQLFVPELPRSRYVLDQRISFGVRFNVLIGPAKLIAKIAAQTDSPLFQVGGGLARLFLRLG